jgi:hypothetical protein
MTTGQAGFFMAGPVRQPEGVPLYRTSPRLISFLHFVRRFLQKRGKVEGVAGAEKPKKTWESG